MRFMYLTTHFTGNRTVLRGMCRIKGHASEVFFESAFTNNSIIQPVYRLLCAIREFYAGSASGDTDRTVGVKRFACGIELSHFRKIFELSEASAL